MNRDVYDSARMVDLAHMIVEITEDLREISADLAGSGDEEAPDWVIRRLTILLFAIRSIRKELMELDGPSEVDVDDIPF